ncbi:hypothetical protein LJC33_01685 [Eubacteriales bacterium OttesenSCG-928-N13]|nr:hypothetical protein [Eubacteriales bacterium OttesenSCG-928-N13]
MTSEQFERERRFSAALAMAKSLLARGDITRKEYQAIRKMFVQKYRPLVGKL